LISTLSALLALLLPSTFLTSLSVAGAGLVAIGRRKTPLRRIGAILLGAGVLGFAGALLLPIDQWLLRPLEDRFPPQIPAHVDGVVVLGGAISADISADRGMPSLNRDAERLVAFVMLARAHPSARLVFAGGSSVAVRGRLTEAEASRSLVEQLGMTPGRVLYDDRSRTTWENAVNALALGQPKPDETWVLVTSASHMPRAIGAFRAAGWVHIVPWPVTYRTTRAGWPAPLQPVANRLAGIDLAAHEWAGLLGYWVRGRIAQLLPGP
jgi:uncharacterized SAM-binding protein YcdF (DUF218 family)